MRTLRSVIALLLIVTITSCAVKKVVIEEVNPRIPAQVKGAVKAHLKDGSTVVYDSGLTVTGTELRGAGVRYALTAPEQAVSTVPLDQVLGMESFRTQIDAGKSFAITLLGIGAFVGVGALLLSGASFGSCPTVYSADGEIEEAELFSNSVAPLFEARDIDLLKTRPDDKGVLSLAIRNEALETHYLNHLQLLEVTHAANEVVLPDSFGEPVALQNPRPVATARNRQGLDVTPALADADRLFYSTDPALIDNATASDMNDWIDVTIPVEPGATAAALAFRMRNSLLNTLLLYDVILAPAGAGALNWMSGNLANISSTVELGRWHQKRAGMHVSVWQDGSYRDVVRISDAGPIAWHDVAAVVPVPPGEKTLRVRLSFVADYWRIDQLRTSTSLRKPDARTVPLSAVRNSEGRPERDALREMTTPDDRYLQTGPGQEFFADFYTGPRPAGVERTFMLSSQGYYTEWIRGSWIQDATHSTPFTPGDDAMLMALRKWRGNREDYERRFFNTKVPVR
jgi:hypothetical protein